ncbi:MAG: orotate phosphoribosyltransferase [Candidatus Micrarchaeota archaeon]|nr:orotate phosphoribosyltransferase [Candidatus Micrarchaeota archaeon]
MKKADVCSVCGKELASFTCRLCGAAVGLSCYDPASGVCIRCRSGRMAGR